MPSVTTPPKFADPQYNSNFHWDQSEDEAVNYDDYEWFKDEVSLCPLHAFISIHV